jgi:choline-sulfatase
MRARTAYYGLVTTLDSMVGRVLDALEQSGLTQDTIVIYSSDHGEHLGNRGLWWKSTLFDEAVKVPLIVSWPSRFPPGERRQSIVNLVDLTATMLDLAGAPRLPHAQGRSFAGLLSDPHAAWIDETVSEYVNDGVPAWSGGRKVISRMVRRGRYKLIYHHGHADQLFDLEQDPHERHDLSFDPAYRPVLDALRERVLADWDPAAIAAQVDRHIEEQALLAAWARAVEPPDVLRWPMQAEDNWLSTEKPTSGVAAS